MIPTRYRNKLPRGLAYPIGAELLSAALAGTPQEPALSVAFIDRPTIFASEFQRLLHTLSRLPVIRAQYRNLPLGLSGSTKGTGADFYDVNWSIDVFPVPAALKAVTRDRLTVDGLSQLRTWLELERPQTWQYGRHSLTLLFDPATSFLAAAEE